MKKIIFIVLFLFVGYGITSAGGWPQPKGKYYIKGYFNLLNGNSIFDGNGDVLDINYDVKWRSIGLYGEYGITDKLTIIANIPVNNSLDISASDKLSGFGDIVTGFKYGISNNGSSSLAISLFQQLGISNREVISGNYLALGDGQYAQTLQIDYGKGFNFGSKNAYFNAYVGYRDRKNGFSDEIKAGLELGSKVFTDKLLFILRSDMVFPDNKLEVDGGFDAGNYFGNNVSYISFSPEFNYFISDNLIVNLGLGGAILAKNIYAAPSISFGIAYKN
jgi:hypothetical protein